MKRLFLAALIGFLLVATPAMAKSLTFQWEQDVMATGDTWELHVSETKGGPYTRIAVIPFVKTETSYEKTVDLTIPPEGDYFVLRKVRASDGEVSAWSNEVFWQPIAGPFNLKLIFN